LGLPLLSATAVLVKRADMRDGKLTPWDVVACETHHSKATVLRVWKRFKNLSWERARAMFKDYPEVMRLRADFGYRIADSSVGIKPLEQGTPCLILCQPHAELYGDSLTMARYVTVDVRNVANVPARECWATIEFVNVSNTHLTEYRAMINGLLSESTIPLHWEGTPYIAIGDDSSFLKGNIGPQSLAHLHVAVAIQDGPLGQVHPDAKFNSDIAAFIERPYGYLSYLGGCSLAIPLAPGDRPPAPRHVPPGEYTVRIRVGCENGEGDSRQYILRSTASWHDLDLAVA